MSDDLPLTGMGTPDETVPADSGWAPPPTGPPSPTPPFTGSPTRVVDAPGTGGQAASLPLAGFWIRFVGLLVDGILFAIVNLLLSALFLSTTTTTVGGIQITVSTGPRLLVDAILLVVELAYCTWFWTNRGATLGQMLVGIRVVDADTGQLLKPSQAVVRYLGYIISGIPLLLGYIWAGFDPRKQGWMDKLANTLVVKGK